MCFGGLGFQVERIGLRSLSGVSGSGLGRARGSCLIQRCILCSWSGA